MSWLLSTPESNGWRAGGADETDVTWSRAKSTSAGIFKVVNVDVAVARVALSTTTTTATLYLSRLPTG